MTGFTAPSLLSRWICCAALGVTTLAACASQPRTAMNDPFADVADSAVAAVTDEPPVPAAAAGNRIQTVSHNEPAPAMTSSPAGVARVAAKAAPAVERAQYVIEHCPPDVRQPLPPTMASHPEAALTPVPRPDRFADEYIFDGGDRQNAVHYSDLGRSGLDSEDTVAEYTQHTGDRKITPSNRVAIYSPRFAAVRSVSVPYQETGLGIVAGSRSTVGGTQMHNRSGTVQQSQTRGGQSLRIRSRASGFEGEVGQTSNVQVARVAGHERLLNTFEDIALVRSGMMLKEDAPQIDDAVQSAMTWTREEAPIILGQIDAHSEVTVLATAADFTAYEDWRKNPGNIRIVKLADKSEAAPGEIVKFTIRYDNLGDFPVGQVRIIDKLTSRLEYVADSAAADREAEMLVEDHEEGSVTLQWDFAEPLDHGEGGVITFEARVR